MSNFGRKVRKVEQAARAAELETKKLEAAMYLIGLGQKMIVDDVPQLAALAARMQGQVNNTEGQVIPASYLLSMMSAGLVIQRIGKFLMDEGLSQEVWAQRLTVLLGQEPTKEFSGPVANEDEMQMRAARAGLLIVGG